MMRIVVEIAAQRLTLYQGTEPVRSYPCSTSRYGAGCQEGSTRTPIGFHEVVEKYGDGVPLGGVFVSRVYTGEIVPPCLEKIPSGQDSITTRILRLRGVQPGINQGGEVDSYRRYIYIHGTPEEGLIGTPASHGCIRMTNADVADLYERVPIGTQVEIF